MQTPQHLGTHGDARLPAQTMRKQRRSRSRGTSRRPANVRRKRRRERPTRRSTNVQTRTSRRCERSDDDQCRATVRARVSPVSPTPLSGLRAERESTVGLSRDSPPPLPARWWPLPLPAASRQTACCVSPAAPTPPPVMARAPAPPPARPCSPRHLPTYRR